MSIYGPIVGADDLRAAVRDHLSAWAPAYIAEVARQAGLDADAVPPFRQYDVRTELDGLPDYDALPALQVLCDELTPRLLDADGDIFADAVVQVRVYAAGRDEESTTQAVARYIKAVRAAVLQHRNLSGAAAGVQWIGEGFAEPVPADRAEAWGAGGIVAFSIAVASPLVNVFDGPTAVPDDPTTDPGDTPTVLTPSSVIAPEET
jgi:hypothetical protein